jgi:hypothetical protein
MIRELSYYFFCSVGGVGCTILKGNAACCLHRKKSPNEYVKNSHRSLGVFCCCPSGHWPVNICRTGFRASFYDDYLSPFLRKYLNILWYRIISQNVCKVDVKISKSYPFKLFLQTFLFISFFSPP